MLPKCGFIFCAVFLFVCSEVNSTLTVIDVPKPRVTTDWWKHEVIYQIFPRTFKEVDLGDTAIGIGNLEGIEENLAHLQGTGITAIWFSQIYDPNDFTKVHSDYGDNDDNDKFKALIKNIHTEYEMKVMVDFDINHSSNKNKWFIESEKKNPEFSNFYVWKDEKSGVKPEPNNWLSVYGDTAWELGSRRSQYYLHQFAIDQPDLNYGNPDVQAAMKEVLKGWLNLGVDGIILDTVPFLFEGDITQNEERIPNIDDYKYESLIHSVTKDQPETFDFIYDLRDEIEQYNKDHPTETPRILITAADTDFENAMRYSKGTDKTGKVRSGAHIPLNFQLLPHNKTTSAIDIVKSINEWLTRGNRETANWLIGNPDQHRAASRFGPQNVDNMNILIASLPGAMITYNGEEIGQANGEVAYVQCKDPIGCKAGPADFPTVSRDFQRTPYQWNNGPNAGFTDSDSDPWLPVSKGKNDQNLAKQETDPISNFKTYKKIVELRKKKLFEEGDVEVEALSKNVIKVTRGSKANQYGNYVILINIGEKSETVEASNIRGQLYEEYNIYEPTIKGQEVWAKAVTILGYTTKIFKVISEEADYDWWRNAVMYQIYVRSFKDSGSDGFGDLNGVINKLEYLKELGVNIICLSSIYVSANQDLGYDITDFNKVDGTYGNNADLERLTRLADGHGIKVIMDFVPNHSSDEHEWFKDDPTTANTRYVMKAYSTEEVPNWLSIYQGPSWSLLPDETDKYYLHQFHSSQPDLNYDDVSVKEDIEKSLKLWLDLGVAGFRMTGVPYLFEDDSFPNEPPSNNLAAKEGDWNSLRHVYTSNLPKTFKLIYDWRELLDKYTARQGRFERILITEAYTDIHNTIYYYGSQGKEGAHLALNFQLIEKVDEKSNANDFAEKINEWVHLIPENFTSNWVLGNHDKHRVATRFGSENVDGFNMLAAILPGVMITYNGEEIGQEDGDIPLENCKGDPIFCPTEGEKDPEVLEKIRKRRRANQRTPFQWDASTFAGFTDGNNPWLPISSNSTVTNLLLQTNQHTSHYELYKRLTKLRKKTAFTNGSLKVKAVTDYVLTTLRYHTANESYFHLFNIGSEEETFNLKTAFPKTTAFLEVVETSDPDRLPTGTLLNANDISLEGHQSVIAKFTEKIGFSTATINVISSFVLLFGVIINRINFY